jgi:hypothetical protein
MRRTEFPLGKRDQQPVLSMPAPKKTPLRRVKTQSQQGVLSLLNFVLVFQRKNLRVASPLGKTTYPNPPPIDSTNSASKNFAPVETTETTQAKRPIFLDSSLRQKRR